MQADRSREPRTRREEESHGKPLAASLREPRWDISSAIGNQGELFVTDVMHSIRDGASVEIKTDQPSPLTQRVFVEYECYRRGAWRPSGIQTTQATLWAFVLGPAGSAVIVVPTERLRDAARTAWKNPRNRLEQSVGKNKARGIGVPLRLLVRAAAAPSFELPAAA